MLTILSRIDKASVADLNRAANAVVAVCRRDMAGVLVSQARGYLSAARKSTPLAPKTVMRNFIVVTTMKHTELVIPTAKAYPYKVAGRGFARAGWALAAKKMGIHGQDYVTGKKDGLSAGHFAEKTQPDEKFLEVGNKVPYIGDLDARALIHERGMMMVYIRARGILERTVARDMERAWGTGIAMARAGK